MINAGRHVVSDKDKASSGAPPNQTVSNEDLNAYIDGQLQPGRRLHVERLIASDEDVRAHVEELRRVRRLVRMAYLFPGKSSPARSDS